MSDETKVHQTGTAERGTYEIKVEGSDVPAVLNWHLSEMASDNPVRVASHVFTPPEARGKGIAFKLVEALIDDARMQGFKIIPQCPYVAAQFKRLQEWANLRAR